MLRLLHFLILGLCFCCHQATAQSNQNQDAHIHGLARMTILYEAGQLLIELETPAANMLGFEHRPQNTQQWQQLSQLKKSLNVPENIIGLQPNCEVKSVEIELPFQQTKETISLPSPPTVEESSHDHHHDHHEETQEVHNHTEPRYNGTSHDVHQDIHVSYEWRCTGSGPRIIQLYLFSLYPSFEKIQAQWVAYGKQGAKTLNKSHAVSEIKL
jgi:hypothetical protein